MTLVAVQPGVVCTVNNMGKCAFAYVAEPGYEKKIKMDINNRLPITMIPGSISIKDIAVMILCHMVYIYYAKSGRMFIFA